MSAYIIQETFVFTVFRRVFHSTLKLELCRHACRLRDPIISICRYGKNMPTTALVPPSLCQRLDSRQLTQTRAPEARGKSSAKRERERERERRRRESLPEAKGERSEPFAGGASGQETNSQFLALNSCNAHTSWISCSFLVCDTD